MLNDTPPKCEYKLLKTDRTTGKQEIIQHEIIDANQKFWMEILPSLYFHLCGKMPVIDNEKETSINFSSIDGMNMLLIGNLDQNKMNLIKEMTKYVEEKMNLNIDSGKTK